MSPDRVDKRVNALEALTDRRIEALTERILVLEKENARLTVLVDALRAERPSRTSR